MLLFLFHIDHLVTYSALNTPRLAPLGYTITHVPDQNCTSLHDKKVMYLVKGNAQQFCNGRHQDNFHDIGNLFMK